MCGGANLIEVDQILDLKNDLGQNRPVHAHGAIQNLIGLLVVGALFLLREVVANDGGLFVHDPLRGFFCQIRRIAPPLGIGGVVAFWPVGPK